MKISDVLRPDWRKVILTIIALLLFFAKYRFEEQHYWENFYLSAEFYWIIGIYAVIFLIIYLIICLIAFLWNKFIKREKISKKSFLLDWKKLLISFVIISPIFFLDLFTWGRSLISMAFLFLIIYIPSCLLIFIVGRLNRESLKSHATIKIVGAISTAIMFSLFIWAIFGFYQLVSLRFLDLEYMESHLGEWKIEPPIELLAGISILSAAIIFILFFRIEMGEARGGKINLTRVFDVPTSLFKKIKSGEYSIVTLLLLILVISALNYLFSTSGIVDRYLLAQSKYDYFDSLQRIQESVGFYHRPWFITPVTDFILILPFSIAISYMYLFALAFFLYWFSRIAGSKIPYLHLFALSVCLLVIPLAFNIVTTIANSIIYLIFNNISALNTAFFPIIGQVMFYIACAFGIKELGDIDLRKSILIVLPFLILILLTIVWNYFLIYEFPKRILEITLFQVGP